VYALPAINKIAISFAHSASAVVVGKKALVRFENGVCLQFPPKIFLTV